MLDLTPELRAELQSFDTPTVCNALEALVPARRGYGYTTEPLFCARPGLPPLVGLARTASIRSAHPSDLAGRPARELSDAYYAYIDEGPKPCVVVIHDMDERRGYGSFWGEVNSAIHKGLGCEGVITDGAVRDLPDIAENGNTVPLAIKVDSPMTANDYVNEIRVIGDANPNPGIVRFHLTPMSGRAEAATRIRLGGTGTVTVLAKTSTGKLYADRKVVKVTVGGCGG